ncbi:methionyl-tRNA formyltransferase [Dolosigranulum savutiense]|uniref:Methionyl-tRNA formyltransferase n=1 Tax=Dolosigranulum savutiense TaxID=3110288 RepID=A0AB74U0E3_9LACT
MKKIIFMGTPQFSVPILEALCEQTGIEVQCVVTQPDRKVGRKRVLTAPPVKQCAERFGINVLQPETIRGSKELEIMKELAPDLIITAAFGQFLPKELLDLPTYGAINIHASLLPKYRGAAPIHYAIKNGDEKTGVTIMYMTPKMDAGDMLAKREMTIQDQHDTGDLFEALSLLGRDLLIDTLPKLLNGELTPVPQDESQVTYAPMISAEEEEIDWTESARAIYNKVRAFRPFPSTHTFFQGERFKLWDVAEVARHTSASPGEIIHVSSDELHVAAGDGKAIALIQVQPAGKSKMSITSYLQGTMIEEGMQFEQTNR